MRQRLAASKGEKQAALLMKLFQNVMNFFGGQLVPPLFLRVIREVAIEVVAVHASQIAAQSDLERHVAWDAGFHRPPVQAFAPGEETGSSPHAVARKVMEPIAASSSMKRHESAVTDSVGTSNSAATAAAICATVCVPSTISQMRRATWFRPSSSWCFTSKRMSSQSTICQALDGERSRTSLVTGRSECLVVPRLLRTF